MKPDLHAVGEALFGQQWQRPLARALGVNERTVHYWRSGRAVPADMWSRIAALCQARGAALTKLAEQISA